MKLVFSPYLKHRTVQTLIALSLALIITPLSMGVLQAHFWWIFLPVVIAPFHEWYAHKFLLHAKLIQKKVGFVTFKSAYTMDTIKNRKTLSYYLLHG